LTGDELLDFVGANVLRRPQADFDFSLLGNMLIPAGAYLCQVFFQALDFSFSSLKQRRPRLRRCLFI
jgi:hypothetical protein